MAKKSGQRKIKLSKNLKPFVSRVVRDGPAQRAFTDNIGHPVGACVSGALKDHFDEFDGDQVHEIVKDCASGVKDKKYSTQPYREEMSRKRREARQRARAHRRGGGGGGYVAQVPTGYIPPY